MEGFAHITTFDGTVSEAAVRVRSAVEAAKWGVLGGYDFGEILASKSFPVGSAIRCLDICAPAHANTMLSKNKLTGLCMPCKILLYEDGGRTQLAAMRPGAMIPQLFPEAGLADYAAGIDEELRAILESAVAR